MNNESEDYAESIMTYEIKNRRRSNRFIHKGHFLLKTWQSVPNFTLIARKSQEFESNQSWIRASIISISLKKICELCFLILFNFRVIMIY